MARAKGKDAMLDEFMGGKPRHGGGAKGRRAPAPAAPGGPFEEFHGMMVDTRLSRKEIFYFFMRERDSLDEACFLLKEWVMGHGGIKSTVCTNNRLELLLEELHYEDTKDNPDPARIAQLQKEIDEYNEAHGKGADRED